MSNPLGGFSLEDARLIHERVLGGKFAQKPADIARLQTTQNDNYYVLLTQDLSAATNTLTGYSQAEARVLKYTPSDSLDMEESTTSIGIITVTNRNVNFSAATGDLLFVIRSGAEWAPLLPSKGGGGGDLTVRFRIVASYFCGQCYADARVISVPYGVSLVDLPDVDTYDNNALRVYDRTGRFLNEPPEDLINRIGYARYMTPLEDGPCPDTYFSAWEIISLPCSEVTCD